MKKNILLLASLLLFSLYGFSQSVQLKGDLRLKPWTKSIQSYCAGGSDYYVLAQNSPNQTEIILDVSKYTSTQLLKICLDKNVSLKGHWLKHTKTNNNPMEQHPVDAPSCEIFVVEKMRLNKKK